MGIIVSMNLLPIAEDRAFMQETDRIIQSFCSNAMEITYVEHGADNMVAIVDDQYVFRFPRGQDAAKRLRFEADILQKVNGKITTLKIPELLYVHADPPYSVSSYVPGAHLTGQHVHSLPHHEQRGIGERLATFIVQFNQAISGPAVHKLRKATGVEDLDEPWETYFERLFLRERLPDERLSTIISEHYTTWQTYVAQEKRIYAIHDDLHQSNLLFNGSTLQGVVDFGDANVGGIEEEMRWLYAMGETVLRSAIEQYELVTGDSVSYEHVQEWAILHELSTYVARLNRHDTRSFPFQRAQAHLRAWLPSFPL